METVGGSSLQLVTQRCNRRSKAGICVGGEAPRRERGKDHMDGVPPLVGDCVIVFFTKVRGRHDNLVSRNLESKRVTQTNISLKANYVAK